MHRNMAKAKKQQKVPASRLGTYVSRSLTGESYMAFVPAILPPKPPLDMSALYKQYEQAMQALSLLNASADLVPDVGLFLYMYVRKEALLSSQIEGTQSSLSDLLLFENDETPNVSVDDVEEVSNYIAALNHGLKRMKNGFPLSNRLIRDMHKIILRGGRGSDKTPGEFRRSQNWIGGIRPGKARFVPPPPEMVDDFMSDLEKFIHADQQQLPILIKAALVHVQFETIHPFLDGNGRLGRLLITLMLCAEGALGEPVLYLSLLFKEHRQTYYDLLTDVRTKGDWELWCAFFLDAIYASATHAIKDTKKIISLLERDRRRISKIGKASTSALRIHAYLLKNPYLSLTKAAKVLKLSVPTMTSTTQKLIEIGMLKEVTGHARNRLFAYTAYLEILTSGTDPLKN